MPPSSPPPCLDPAAPNGPPLPSAPIKNPKKPEETHEQDLSFDYGWVVVGAGALMTCVGFGSMLSLAVFLQPISESMGWSRAGVSAAATLDFLFMGFAAFFWGALSDRFGTRIVVLAGSLLARPRPGHREPGAKPAGNSSFCSAG